MGLSADTGVELDGAFYCNRSPCSPVRVRRQLSTVVILPVSAFVISELAFVVAFSGSGLANPFHPVVLLARRRSFRFTGPTEMAWLIVRIRITQISPAGNTERGTWLGMSAQLRRSLVTPATERRFVGSVCGEDSD